MKITDFCKSYFNGFQDVSNYKKNDSKTNVLAALKILSYFTVIIPLGFAAVYGAASLYGRVSKKEPLSSQDKNVNNQAKKTLAIDTSKVNSQIDLLKLQKIKLSEVLNTYYQPCRPNSNQENLLKYSSSKAYKRHAKTARIYYNSSQLTQSDALKIVFQREPTNIAMGKNQYNEENLQKLFGYRKGVYNDLDAKKTDGSSFKDLPNSVTVYSETYLWDPPGGKNKKEIACLSLPAPALDRSSQPHYKYYMITGKLDAVRYEQEMEFLFKTIEKVVRDNKNLAFGGKGIKRLVLSRFGQGAFLEALTGNDQEVAHNAYKRQMANFLNKIKDTDLKIVMSEYSDPGHDIWHDKMIIGDIIKTSKEGDLIINAWDPHSAPGNGNDADRSFDGAMGKGSGILLTQTSWLNETLRSQDALVGVK